MLSIVTRITSSPALIRAFPFCLFVLLTACQGKLGAASAFWVYLLKCGVGAALILAWRPLILEMRWKFSWEAVLVGVGVFVVWVGLDPFYPKTISAGSGWNPFTQFPDNDALAWMFVAGRILGASLVVPPIEEVFYRSLLYRWIAHPEFSTVPVGLFAWKPFVVTALVFGFAHAEWLAGILCACAYQGLVCWKKRLGDAMTAHAITNALLGLWVVWKGAWHFW